ncbi:MAG: RagB/SusD family nutrient uptake outer membrane protein [Mucilaginibacter sp.]|uniref:RagB/SusD family nutrient uptake outer membrane protein n=1 Tax=Mucilaginibacter sp. TaxID=1882438 RepID=UPI0031B1283F
MLQLFGACKLDETIYDQATPVNAIKSRSDLEFAMIGVYTHLNATPGFNRDITWALHPYADDLSSIAAFEAGNWGRKALINSGTPFVNSVYVNFFATIRDVHGIIDNINKLDPDADYKAKMIAEAHFIRAFCYFNLVQLYGGVPLVTASVDAGSDFYQPRASVDEVYALIFSDLADAVTNLPTRTTQPAAEFYRATKGAAQGYLAKAYLTYANYLDLHSRSSESAAYYEKARDNAGEVISSGQYQLIADYGALWDVSKEKASYAEVIFGIPHMRDPADLTLSGEGAYYPAHLLPATYPNSTGLPTRAGNGFVRVQPWFFEYYNKGDYQNDYRVEKTFLSVWIDATNKRHVAYPLPFVAADTKEAQAFIVKYVDGAGLSTFGHENDLFLLRLSEVYLIKAEAENELNGPSAVALAAFNAVRARARQANGTPRLTPADVTPVSAGTKEDLRLKIFDERGLEFVAEFNRFFDLIRMRYRNTGKSMYEYQFSTFLPSLTPGLPKVVANAWAGGATEATNIIPYNAKYLLWPIPANQMAVNPKLTQNPGW